MKLERGEALRTRHTARPPALESSDQTARIAVAPPEMRIDRKEDRRSDRLGAGVEPELVMAVVIIGDGMQPIAGQFAEDRQRP